jgi:hypothetical protein
MIKMLITRKLLGTAALAAILAAGCGGGTQSSGPQPCVNVQQVTSQMNTYHLNAVNGTPIPPGAPWPEKSRDLAEDPQVTDAPWDQSGVNSLYWGNQSGVPG